MCVGGGLCVCVLAVSERDSVCNNALVPKVLKEKTYFIIFIRSIQGVLFSECIDLLFAEHGKPESILFN